MAGEHPKMERFILGCLFFIALTDGWIRSQSSFTEVCNPGVAFGISIPQTLLMAILFLLLFVAWWQWRQATESWVRLAWAAIFLGGSVNTLDRLIQGCVRDYLTVSLFPSFNLADMMLFLGVLYLFGRLIGIFSIRKPYVS